ncbi:MAG: CRISPR-associated endonuclease Cas2 [Scytonema sp. PMC 1069.18]|nr:CRISPR-associated endonuclease Cas2 [Scytonema sp. PMC 1069.18]MEC4885056.1 CRISPR-associated endonuclease Cas2 [Scytonema sp. PMC 1070.18]
MLLYLVTYDIPCDKRRKKVSDLLEGYGQRVQYSVFECKLTSAQYKELCQRLKKKVKLSEDSVRFYPLSQHTLDQVQAWGVGPPVTEAPGSIVI